MWIFFENVGLKIIWIFLELDYLWLNYYFIYCLFDSYVFKVLELFNFVFVGVELLVLGILGLEIFVIFFVF